MEEASQVTFQMWLENMKCQECAIMEEMQNFKKCYYTLPLRNKQFI